MALAVVQAKTAGSSANPSTPQVTFSSAPTNGNLLIATYFLDPNLSAINTAGGWQMLGIAYTVNSDYLITLYKYAGAGESTTQTPDNASTSHGWALSVWEVSGVSGKISQDFADFQSTLPTNYPGTSATPSLVNGFTNELVLLASENGNVGATTVSISGGGTWTLDSGPAFGNQQGYNQTAYGWSQALSTSGNTLNPTLTSSAANRFYVNYTGLTISQPTTPPQVKQATYGTSSASTAVSAVFQKAPANGSLLVAMAYVTQTIAPTAGSGWTLDSSVLDATAGFYVATYYKYAGAGESTTQTPDSALRNGWDVLIWEITGVGGTWAGDHVATTLFKNVASPYTPSTVTTSVNNELVLYGAVAVQGAVNPGTIASSSGSQHIAGLNPTGSGYAHGAAGWHYLKSTLGAALSPTFTVTSGGANVGIGIAAIELKVGAGASTETSTVGLTLSKVSFKAVRPDTVAATLALQKINYTIVASRKETFTGSLALSGVALKAGVINLGAAGAGAVHFATFGA